MISDQSSLDHVPPPFPSPTRGRGRGELYQNPPFTRDRFTGHRSERSLGAERRDYFEDITNYVLGVVRSLEMPEEELREKEEFCRELDKIVRRVRRSTSRSTTRLTF
jgi:hypothetical protein